MTNVQEQFSAFNQKALSAALDFAALSFSNAERFLDMHIEAVKGSLEESAESLMAFSSAKAPQELLALRSRLLETSVARASSYARTVYELVAEAQAETSELIEAQVAAFHEDVGSAVEQAARSASEGVSVAVAQALPTAAVTPVKTTRESVAQTGKPNLTSVKTKPPMAVTTGKNAKGRK
jgi:phasin family protein